MFYCLIFLTYCAQLQHINICFYYFRKLSKYWGDVKVKFTTTDTFFDQKIEGVYKKILSQPNAEEIKLKSSDLVQDYPYGCYLSCNTPWVLVDHVLIPMNVGERFDIKMRTLFVYNSFRSGVEDTKVMVHMQRMSVVIVTPRNRGSGRIVIFKYINKIILFLKEK